MQSIVPLPTIALVDILYMQDYRKLNVWSRAHAHILKVRDATNRFPRSGYASLKLQLTRSAESIAFNIVEGCGASTRKEFARYLDVSIKSASETEYQLKLACDYSVLDRTSWEALSDETVTIRKMLCGLRSRVIKADLEPEDQRNAGNPDRRE